MDAVFFLRWWWGGNFIHLVSLSPRAPQYLGQKKGVFRGLGWFGTGHKSRLRGDARNGDARQGCPWVPESLGQALVGHDVAGKMQVYKFFWQSFSPLFEVLEPGTEARDWYKALTPFTAVLSPKNTLRDYISHKAVVPWHVGSARVWTSLDTVVASHGHALGTTMSRWVAGCWDRMFGVTCTPNQPHRPPGSLVACTGVSPPRCSAAGSVTPGSPLFACGRTQGAATGECGQWDGGIAWIWEEIQSPCCILQVTLAPACLSSTFSQVLCILLIIFFLLYINVYLYFSLCFLGTMHILKHLIYSTPLPMGRRKVRNTSGALLSEKIELSFFFFFSFFFSFVLLPPKG